MLGGKELLMFVNITFKKKNRKAVMQLRQRFLFAPHINLCQKGISCLFVFVFSPEADFLEAICWFPMVFYTVGSIDK